MRKSFLITIGVFAGVAALINLFLQNPTFNKLSDKADFELQANQPELAENTLYQIVLADSFKIENHYKYINTHFSIPEKKKVGKNRYEYRDDKTIASYYNSLSHSADSRIADIGFYGAGLIQVNLKNYPASIGEFLNVKNKQLNYLNNSIGNAYNKSGYPYIAERYFRLEIRNNGNLEGAYSNLIQLLFEQHRTAELGRMLSDPVTKKYFPSRIERAIYFKTFQPIKYAKNLLEKSFSGFNFWGALAAFLIMGSWVMYLRKLDIYEVEKWNHIGVTILLGMVFSFLTYPLSDFDNLIFGFRLNGNLLNDFFYSVIGIGAIEEFVKIVPLLLMMKFTKAVNEPFDYIKYASLSALGFAFVENLIYFNESNLSIIHGRALTAVVSHMFDSSIIAYGIILNRYKRYRNPYLNFIFFFALASLAHGFYDFWLINESANTFSIVTFIFLIVSMYMWISFMNNALNHSDFFDKDKSMQCEQLQDYLLYSLVGILLFEYIAIAIRFSPDIANRQIISSVYSGTYLILFLSGNLSRFTLRKGIWSPIRYWQTDEKINFEDLVNTDLKIDIFTKNEYTLKFLPNSGCIIKRLTVSKEEDWYLFKLDSPRQINAYLSENILIRTKEKFDQIERGKKKFIAFYLIPTGTNMEKENLLRTDFKYCGWATAE